jgi:hypothetical protein
MRGEGYQHDDAAHRPEGTGSERPYDLLTAVSLLYLALPVAIFLAGWLRPLWAAVGLLGLLGLLARVAPPRAFRLEATVPALAIALAAALLSGVGGAGLQNWDYNKHNALLHDLIRLPWPVRYADLGDADLAGPLVYYSAWYLPAALVGKFAGWEAANVVHFLWTLAGLVLALRWFGRFTHAKWGPPFLIAFSGLDVLGVLFSGKNPIALTNLEFHHWAGFAQYTHNLAGVNWVPHHAIPIWLGTSLVLSGQRRAWFLLPLWSPWAWVGTAPFLPLSGRSRRPWRIALLSLPALLGFAYLSSSRGQVVQNWAWQGKPTLAFLGSYVGFVVLEFGVIAVLTWAILRPTGRDRHVLGLAIALLLVLPLYRFGISGDLTMRASMPALFVLAVYAYRALAASRAKLRFALASVLLVGALAPLHEAAYSIVHYRWGPPAAGDLVSLPMTDGRPYARQFLGDPRKPFWRFLGR